MTPTPRVRVIGIGEPAAGDDGVGRVVLERLRSQGVPDDVELHEVRDPTEIVDLLAGAALVVVIDAVIGGRPGEVLDLRPEELAARGMPAVSTHVVGVLEAIELASVLHAQPQPPVRVVGVAIEPPSGLGAALSPAVAAAVPGAVGRVRALCAR